MNHNHSAYYDELKQLARSIREDYDLNNFCVQRSDLRRIYKGTGIDYVDLWPPDKNQKSLKKLRGAYFRDDCGCTVMLARGLPEEPTIFTMAHELKHHLADQEIPVLFCDESNLRQEIEIGAEIFAAELIFPDSKFCDALIGMGIEAGQCTPEVLVRLKHDTQTTLSYSSLAKRAELFQFASKSSVVTYRGWKKLEESIYGEPVYKRVLRARRSSL